MISFEGENMQTQNTDFGYRIDLYLHDYRLAKEIDKNEHSDRNIDHKIKIQKIIEKKIGWKFIRIDPEKEGLDIFRTIKEMFSHI